MLYCTAFFGLFSIDFSPLLFPSLSHSPYQQAQEEGRGGRHVKQCGWRNASEVEVTMMLSKQVGEERLGEVVTGATTIMAVTREKRKRSPHTWWALNRAPRLQSWSSCKTLASHGGTVDGSMSRCSKKGQVWGGLRPTPMLGLDIFIYFIFLSQMMM